MEAWSWEMIKDQGPLVVFFGAAAYYFLRKAEKAKDRHIRSLEKEIERVVKERNNLEDMVLKNRQSSKKG